MAEFISIAAYNQREPAEQLTAKLRDAGYDSELFDESLEQKWHLFQISPHAQFRVRVRAAEYERALDQLKQWEGKDEALNAAVHCPECGSTLVEYPQFSRRTLLGALPAVAAAAGVIEKDYYCEACHYTWPAEMPKPGPEVDRLNWPKSWKV